RRYIFGHEDTKPRRKPLGSSCVLRVFVTSWLHFWWWVHFVGSRCAFALSRTAVERKGREGIHSFFASFASFAFNRRSWRCRVPGGVNDRARVGGRCVSPGTGDHVYPA